MTAEANKILNQPIGVIAIDQGSPCDQGEFTRWAPPRRAPDRPMTAFRTGDLTDGSIGLKRPLGAAADI